MNILVVEDEHRVADFIIRGLRAEGWTAEHADNGEVALEILSRHEFDIVLLDLMLPGMSCLLYTSPSPRDQRGSRMPSSA